MPDLKERFSAVDDEIAAPDLWGEARRRAAAPDGRPVARGGETAWAPARHRVVTAAVAFAVFAAAAVFAWDLSHPDPGPRPRPAVDLGSELPVGWSELPAPPENRSDAATAWTGTQLLVWGGFEYVGSNEDPDNDGFVFDAATERWSELPESPLAGRAEAAAAWTGRELLVWGGWDGGFRDPPFFDDGAAFDPEAGTWRMLPPAPLTPRSPFSVWTGEELIVWGSTDRSDRMRDGAAYDLSSDSWRTIAEAPLDVTDGSAVWTGAEMIVFGAALDGNNRADTRTSIGIAYDPVADSWRELPPSDLSPQAMTAAWVGDAMIAWDYDHASASYDPVTNAWRSLPDVPLAFSECRPVSVATARTVFGEFCGKTVVFSPKDDTWHRDQIPLEETEEGCCSVLEPAVAADVVLVASHWYGKALEAMDRRMFAYNPPPVVRTDARGEVLEPEPFIPPTERDGDRIRMPMTFPDGREAILSYPIPLDLAMIGVQPDVSYLWSNDPAPRFPIRLLHDPNASIAEYVDGKEPVGGVAGQDGQVEVWKARGNDVRRRFWLRFELPSWTALVSVRDHLSSAEQVASSLLLRETEGGFPIALASGPIELSHESGEGEGPVLSISNPAGIMQLFPEGCSPESSGDLAASEQHFSRCFDARVFMTVTGTPRFVTDIAEGVDVSASWPVEPMPFVPEPDVVDGIARLRLTFPNGSSATLTYPTRYGLAAYGIQPDAAWVVPGEVGPTPIMFVHGPLGVERNYVVGAEPLKQVLSESRERLAVWEALPSMCLQADPCYWLVYRYDVFDPEAAHLLDGWTVLVGLPDEGWAEEVASSIQVFVNAGGFPSVSITGRLQHSSSAGEGRGAQLTIADADPTSGVLNPASEGFATIEISPLGCEASSGPTLTGDSGNVFASRCFAGRTVAVWINGDRQVVESLAGDLRIEDFRAA